MGEHTVFIDGAAGTTGLEIAERLTGRREFDLIQLSDAERKDADCRRTALNAVDFAILCLPDDAAREAVAMLDPDGNTRVIDASSAHRTASDWSYGFPEIVGTEVIAGAKRVSNPGCYPTGFLGLIAPLTRAGLLPRSWPYTLNAVSGYSGGGKAMIARFDEQPQLAFCAYGLTLGHKHLPEMQRHAGLDHAPVFSPAVIPAHRGMLVDIPLPIVAMKKAAPPAELLAALHEFYANSPVVTVHSGDAAELVIGKDDAPSDRLDLYVFAGEGGNSARLVARLDNLGKGASGAAVQSLNLMAGCEETSGLRI